MICRRFARAALIFAFAAGVRTAHAQPPINIPFIEFAASRAVETKSRKPEKNLEAFGKICPFKSDEIAARVLLEYGSVFTASEAVQVPTKCIFETAGDVEKFQKKLKTATAEIGRVEITLQTAAMSSLLAAIKEVGERRLKITPLDGSIAGSRTYWDTERIWKSRFEPALKHWVRRGRITSGAAANARSMSMRDQVDQVVEWESRGLYFSTNFSRSIFSSVAPPGTSQHLSLLAFDVVEYGKKEVRVILNKHGWFQTVAADEPHFTYLGITEDKLPKRGLKLKMQNGHRFWVPDIPVKDASK